MLILSRRGESVTIGDEVTITVLGVQEVRSLSSSIIRHSSIASRTAL